MSQSEKRKTGKLKIIIYSVIAFIILLLVVLFKVVGFDNIKSVYYGLKYDQQEIETMREENSRNLEEKVKEHSYIVAREPTKEEMDALNSGEITSEELSKIISNGITLQQFRENRDKQQAEQSAEPEKQPSAEVQAENVWQPKQEQVSEATKPAASEEAPEADNSAQLQAECDSLVSQIVAKMYILRSSFTSSLSGLAGQAYADYEAGVPKAELASKYIGQAAGLEAQCDGNVDALMSELRGILTKYGRPTDLVDTIYATYNNEKQYTKAHYMGLYLNN